MIGIYQIQNLINLKRYIGMSGDIKARWRDHKCRHTSQSNIAKAFRKYGIENFAFTVLETCGIKSLADREIFWIAKLKPEYNCTTGGDGTAGHTFSKEVKARLSAHGKIQWARRTPEEREAFIRSNLFSKGFTPGRYITDETKEKLRKANLGKRATPLTCFRQSQSMRRTRAAHPYKPWGKPVVQIAANGLGTYWRSTRDAAAALGFSPSNITHVIKGQQRTAGGFRWAHFTCSFFN